MKWLKRIVVGLFAVIFLVAAGGWWALRSSLPQTEGSVAVKGASGPIEIVREANGIPHISAKTELDAYFGLGFAHAQDRLWQMEMNRRVASGRTAEILGEKAVDVDKFLRTLGVRRNAEEIFKRATPQTKAMLEAYARGVNAFLDSRKGMLPPEFLITQAPAPEPWTPVDSVAWTTMMAWSLAGNWTNELTRFQLAQKTTLSTAQINEFVWQYPGVAAPNTLDYAAFYRGLGTKLASTAQEAGELLAHAPMKPEEGMGSNNWVVNGTRSETGKPLLANDPHLTLEAPALWYFARLYVPGSPGLPLLDTIGATLPGVPGVVLGRNQKIAWGWTNTNPDVADFFLERVKPDDSNQYQTPEGWAKFESYSETIKVKGKPDVPLTVRRTRHGPVLSGVFPGSIDHSNKIIPGGYVLAFTWTAIQPEDRTVNALPLLSKAQNWAEFKEAVRDYGGPMQNMVYADVDGNIGLILPGRVPIRKPENDLKGVAPAPGWDAKYDWAGFIPFDELYSSYNPAGGTIITANEKTVSDDYKPYITSEWFPPFRARRIHELMQQKSKHTLASFRDMHADVKSPWMGDLLPNLKKTAARSADAKAAFALIDRWDGTMDATRPEPLIAAAWMREMSRHLYRDELGADLFKAFFDHRGQFMVNTLNDMNGQSRWCDITSTPAKETCGEIQAIALDAAVEDLKRRYGTDMSKWKWGSAHYAKSEHRPFSRVKPLDKWFDIRTAVGGDTFTVNVSRYVIRNDEEPFAGRHAASVRFLYDLSDLEKSRFIYQTGQSGHPMSPLYRAFAKPWGEVDYVPMRLDKAKASVGSLGTLTLESAR